ncbi:hypothetical protein C4573_03920 [Candidatus Woesearchaeota archaeon]|nr:MAG: hypothetical protein C4573_03920 [Candidatus Woesearchaeota archaeon]
MPQKTDIQDFLKKESDATQEYIKNFLHEQGIFDLDKEDQIIETAKCIAKFPWGEARTIEELLVTKKFGTCTAKHSALQACYDSLGIKCHQVMSTFKWGEQKISFPEELQKIIDEGEWNHGHNFLQIEKDDGTKIDIDTTWNSKLKEFGFRTFPEDWDGKSSFVGFKINQRWNNVAMKAKKIELIESLSPELRARRERFLKSFVQWVHSINQIDD